MLHVAVAVGTGMDLTQASTEAGFASPAHFSDSFHTMFGLTAHTLLSANTRLVVLYRRSSSQQSADRPLRVPE